MLVTSFEKTTNQPVPSVVPVTWAVGKGHRIHGRCGEKNLSSPAQNRGHPTIALNAHCLRSGHRRLPGGGPEHSMRKGGGGEIVPRFTFLTLVLLLGEVMRKGEGLFSPYSSTCLWPLLIIPSLHGRGTQIKQVL